MSKIVFTGGPVPNTKRISVSVITVGLIIICQVILRHWKATKAPEMKEWINAIVKKIIL